MRDFLLRALAKPLYAVVLFPVGLCSAPLIQQAVTAAAAAAAAATAAIVAREELLGG